MKRVANFEYTTNRYGKVLWARDAKTKKIVSPKRVKNAISDRRSNRIELFVESMTFFLMMLFIIPAGVWALVGSVFAIIGFTTGFNAMTMPLIVLVPYLATTAFAYSIVFIGGLRNFTEEWNAC